MDVSCKFQLQPCIALDILSERPPDNWHYYSVTTDGRLLTTAKRACSHFDALY